MKGLSLLSIFMLLTACGGGGGGGALVDNTPTVATPTYTYESQDDLDNIGGTPNEIISSVISSRGSTHGEGQYRWIMSRTNGISISFSDPDYGGAGNQKITIEFAHNLGTSSDAQGSHNYDTDNYDWGASGDANLDNQHILWTKTFNASQTGLYGNTMSAGAPIACGSDYQCQLTYAFNDEAEKTSYVSQFMTINTYACGGFCVGMNNISSDVWVLVAGDPTQTGDMPSTGSASYNVIGQMMAQGWWEGSDFTRYHVQGDGAFNTNFGSRTITGNMTWDKATYYLFGSIYEDESITFGDTSFDGTINGVTFSGDVQWGDPESYGGVGTFNGSFFGPNASDMGGIFFVHKDNDLEGIDNKDYWTLSGTFTGCTTC